MAQGSRCQFLASTLVIVVREAMASRYLTTASDPMLLAHGLTGSHSQEVNGKFADMHFGLVAPTVLTAYLLLRPWSVRRFRPIRQRKALGKTSGGGYIYDMVGQP